MRASRYWLGTLLLTLGTLILLFVGVVYAYGAYERFLFERDLALREPVLIADAVPTETPTPQPTETPTPEPTATPRPTASVASSSARGTPSSIFPTVPPTATPSPTNTPSPTPVAPMPAERIIISKIKLDTTVVESPLRNGEWVVPKFIAGHLEGTAQPGGPGNAVYSGHVSSIASGDVFADLGKLEPGDEIVIRTKAGDLWYLVTEKKVVKNNEISVVRSFGDERITLLTCTGTWMPLVRDFSHRLIIVAHRELR